MQEFDVVWSGSHQGQDHDLLMCAGVPDKRKGCADPLVRVVLPIPYGCDRRGASGAYATQRTFAYLSHRASATIEEIAELLGSVQLARSAVNALVKHGDVVSEWIPRHERQASHIWKRYRVVTA